MDKEKGEAVTHLYLKYVDDGTEIQLTRGTDSSSSPKFSPDGEEDRVSDVAEAGGRGEWRRAGRGRATDLAVRRAGRRTAAVDEDGARSARFRVAFQ